MLSIEDSRLRPLKSPRLMSPSQTIPTNLFSLSVTIAIRKPPSSMVEITSLILPSSLIIHFTNESSLETILFDLS